MSLDVYLSKSIYIESDDNVIYSANITHNLNKMAIEADIYEHLWRPEDIEIQFASQLIDPLTAGLERLRSDPERFKKFNPPNYWGDYECLLIFVENYINACIANPTARVIVSR